MYVKDKKTLVFHITKKIQFKINTNAYKLYIGEKIFGLEWIYMKTLKLFCIIIAFGMYAIKWDNQSKRFMVMHRKR